MALKDSLIKINLISNRREIFSNNVINWIITTGKVIIILTELIALSALSYRFIIDRQIIDLHDEIKRKEALLNQESKKESEYRHLQSSLNNIHALNEETESKIASFNNIYSVLKEQNLNIKRYSITNETISIEGAYSSVYHLVNLIDKIKTVDSVLLITISELKNDQEGANFIMDITLKVVSSVLENIDSI